MGGTGLREWNGFEMGGKLKVDGAMRLVLVVGGMLIEAVVMAKEEL